MLCFVERKKKQQLKNGPKRWTGFSICNFFFFFAILQKNLQKKFCSWIVKVRKQNRAQFKAKAEAPSPQKKQTPLLSVNNKVGAAVPEQINSRDGGLSNKTVSKWAKTPFCFTFTTKNFLQTEVVQLNPVGLGFRYCLLLCVSVMMKRGV